MKSKRIIKSIFIVYIVLIALLTSFVYYQSSSYLLEHQRQVPWNIGNDMLDHFMRVIDENDVNYHMYQYDEIDEYNVNALNKIFVDGKSESQYIYEDVGLDYTIVNLKNGHKINRHNDVVLLEDMSFDRNYIYGVIEIGENANIVQNNVIIGSFNSFVQTPHMVYYQKMLDYLKLHKLDGQFKLNIPSDYQIIYRINLLKYQDSTIAGAIIYNANYYDISLLIMGIIVLITFVLMLLLPYGIISEMWPFRIIKRIKALFVITILGTLCTLTGGVLLGVGKGILSSELLFNPLISEEYVLILCALSTICFVYFVSLSSYYIKYIFKDGLIRFLKEDTLVAYVIGVFKKFMTKFIEIDLAKQNNRNLFIFILINVVALSLMVLLKSFGILFIVIYGILAYIFLKERFNSIQIDYLNVLYATKQLANGNFDDEEFRDAGVFTSLQDELKNIKEGFKKAVIEETKASKMKTELISNVSHDLKTPLTGIKNYIELLDNDDLDQNTRKTYLKTLDNYANRFKALIDDLFEVSKANSGDIKLNLTNLDIVTLIKQVVDENNDILNEHYLKVLINSDVEHLNLMLDGDKTYRIINNLLVNASKYSADYSRIYIDILNDEDNVTITFKNMSREMMNFTGEEILERFVRGDKSRTDGGSGLGLAIVKSFTEAQGGSFKVVIDGDLFKAIIKFKM